MKQMHILGIGNSYMDDSLWNIIPFLDKDYDDIDITILYCGGCSIDAHIKHLNENWLGYEIHRNKKDGWKIEYNKSMTDAISLNKWDHIFFIQGTGDGISDHGYIESYLNLSLLLNKVKELNNNDKTKYHLIESWADKDNDMRDYETERHKTSKNMFNAIENVIDNYIIKNNIIDVVKVGKEIEKVKEKIDYRLLYRDTNHLSLEIGRNIAASTIASHIKK